MSPVTGKTVQHCVGKGKRGKTVFTTNNFEEIEIEGNLSNWTVTQSITTRSEENGVQSILKIFYARENIKICYGFLN